MTYPHSTWLLSCYLGSAWAWGLLNECIMGRLYEEGDVSWRAYDVFQRISHLFRSLILCHHHPFLSLGEWAAASVLSSHRCLSFSVYKKSMCTYFSYIYICIHTRVGRGEDVDWFFTFSNNPSSACSSFLFLYFLLIPFLSVGNVSLRSENCHLNNQMPPSWARHLINQRDIKKQSA